ncbi:hypothetical protein CC1G_15284 [Coprinopsis cinerea okayama7|uniref:Uncharacterized protein n=1 Tax=Coprinopsis cinerea (strain Okayama-7 / 130 / ATCC MYA-4618 / FGSC 9003) TaxID=240176 RepID=D6RQ77_COPC7|nr:hypothetical protein CC1G_15284 [Coprinopsis cinerea okayama7\|eukprot:XP_002910377.1 hypothetical protein CC1G_15284 [Coprinopsis cinerea okayama7\
MYDYARENVKDMEKAEEIESHKTKSLLHLLWWFDSLTLIQYFAMLASLPPELIIKIANISLVGANAIVTLILTHFAFHSKSELMSRLFEQVMLLPCIKHLTLSEWGKKIFNLFRTHPGWAFPVLEKLDLRSLSCLSHGDQRDLMEFQEMIGLIAKGSPSLSTLFIEVRMEGPELDKPERGS